MDGRAGGWPVPGWLFFQRVNNDVKQKVMSRAASLPLLGICSHPCTAEHLPAVPTCPGQHKGWLWGARDGGEGAQMISETSADPGDLWWCLPGQNLGLSPRKAREFQLLCCCLWDCRVLKPPTPPRDIALLQSFMSGNPYCSLWFGLKNRNFSSAQRTGNFSLGSISELFPRDVLGGLMSSLM